MKYYTNKAVNELRKMKDINGLIRLWELEKEHNQVYLYDETLKQLSHCQKETLKEQITKGLRLGLSNEDLQKVKDFFCIKDKKDYGVFNKAMGCEYPF